MNVYRKSAEPSSIDDRPLRWTELRLRAFAHRLALLCSLAILALRFVRPEQIPRIPLFALLAFVTWTFWRLRVAVCPACDQHVLARFSHFDSFLGVVATHCTRCGTSVGEATVQSLVEDHADDALARRSPKWDRWAGRCAGALMAAVALFTYDVSGGIVTLNGSMSARDSVVPPEDTELGRREHVGSGPRVVTDVGEFNWVDGEPGPVIARVRVGRLTGRLYPESVERDDGVYEGYLP
jgi:hypothetical protein